MMNKTLKTKFGEFQLVPASELGASLDLIPTDPGVYLWLIKHGEQLLDVSSYLDTDDQLPMIIGDYAHLYTGSAFDLKYRIGQHVRNESTENSSPRKSLLALEHVFCAMTQIYGGSYGDFKAGGLSRWMSDNVIFGFQLNDEPVWRETELIRQMISPFNIAYRRQHKYSKYLMAWRAIAFPSGWMESIPLQSKSNRVSAAVAQNRLAMVSAVNVK